MADPDEAIPDEEQAEFEPWTVLYRDEPWPGQEERRADLGARDHYEIAENAFVARGAHVVAEALRLGEWSFVASGCLIRGDVEIGPHCSLNAGVVTQGRVRIGEGVRIASNAALLGFNHVFEDLETPIWLQGETREGVVVEDDVWIGMNVVVLDGVTVGAHSVLAAGAVITKDVEPYGIVAGVPARVIRSRLDDPNPARREALSELSDRVAEQWPDALERCRTVHEQCDSFIDRPGEEWGPRPLNDAIEIAAAFDAVPDGFDRDELVERLHASQDPVTGLFPDPTRGLPDDPLAPSLDDEWSMYGILSTGYALEILGAGPRHPIHVIESCGPGELHDRLDALDMGLLAWPSGSWIDAYSTGVYLNGRHHGSADDAAVLWGWLLTHQHPTSGMWGDHLDPIGDLDLRWLMAVNGFYRLTRGSYAQFGVPVPNIEHVVDTVLEHCGQRDWFADRERTACNVLDIVHPLWLASRQTDHRRAEIRAGVGRVLDQTLEEWVDGQGFAFETGATPGLQGTEMWLSTVYLAADLLGVSDGLPWSPRGVHRLEPATTLTPAPI